MLSVAARVSAVCQALVRPPSPRDQAKEAFTALDLNCAGFIPADKLQDLMAK